jgi:hypothetical protein
MEMDNQKRETRDASSRESAMRPKRWMPPQLLPEPTPEEGYAYRWIRLSTLNNSDPVNISSKLREGWEPVKAADHPEMYLVSNPNSRFPDGIEVGGLLLCKTPVEFVAQRDEWFSNIANSQMESVDNTFMRESDPRMPMFKERSSKVTLGNR